MPGSLVDRFGIEVPIFAFSHCRDVVVEVTRAGGMGVLGAAWMTTDELEASLKWIDDRVNGKPYGVDVVFPGTFAAIDGTEDLTGLLPDTHVAQQPTERSAPACGRFENGQRGFDPNHSAIRNLELDLARLESFPP